MWLSPVITTPASGEPLSRAAAKRHLGIDDADTSFDTLVDEYVAAARAHVESYTGSALTERTVDMACTSFDDFARLNAGPVQSITSISYIDTTGAAQTLDSAVYELWLDGLETSLKTGYGQSWPAIRAGSRITVRAVVGYDAIPPELLQALRMLISFWFVNREGAGGALAEPPFGVTALLENWRRF